jgi:hypothetical protein
MTTCVICLDEVEVADRIVTPCSHTFHSKCIEAWKKIKQTCPTCRLNFSCDNLVVSYAVDHDDDDLVQYYFQTVEEFDDELDFSDSEDSETDF